MTLIQVLFSVIRRALPVFCSLISTVSPTFKSFTWLTLSRNKSEAFKFVLIPMVNKARSLCLFANSFLMALMTKRTSLNLKSSRRFYSNCIFITFNLFLSSGRIIKNINLIRINFLTCLLFISILLSRWTTFKKLTT